MYARESGADAPRGSDRRLVYDGFTQTHWLLRKTGGCRSRGMLGLLDRDSRDRRRCDHLVAQLDSGSRFGGRWSAQRRQSEHYDRINADQPSSPDEQDVRRERSAVSTRPPGVPTIVGVARWAG